MNAAALDFELLADAWSCRAPFIAGEITSSDPATRRALDAYIADGLPGLQRAIGVPAAARVPERAAKGGPFHSRTAVPGPAFTTDTAHAGLRPDAEESLSRIYGIVSADQIEEADVSLLCDRPVIVENALNLVEGNPDTGKTMAVLGLAASLSAGRRLPYGAPGSAKPRGVLFLTAEDSLETTVVRRLRAAEADLSRVHVQKSEGADLLLPGAVDALRVIVRERDIGLVVMDPLNSYLDASKVDVHKEQQVRAALKPVRDFAEEERVTVIGLRHLNKASDKPALYRGGGSIALLAVARNTLLVARHPEDPQLRVVVVQKCNVVPDDVKQPVAFRIQTDARGRPRVEWLAEDVHIDADELLAPKKPGPTPDTLETAKRYVRDHLANGPKLKRDVQELAAKVRISESTLERAAKALGVVSSPQGRERMWSLP